MRVTKSWLSLYSVDNMVTVILFAIVAFATLPLALSSEWAQVVLDRGQDNIHYVALGRSLRIGKGFNAYGRGELDHTWWPEIEAQTIRGSRSVRLYAAEGIAAEDVLATDWPETQRLPGYPLFISMFVDLEPTITEINRILMVQSVLASLAVVLLYRFLRSEQISIVWSSLASFLFATHITYLRRSLGTSPDIIVTILNLVFLIALYKCGARNSVVKYRLLAAAIMVLMTSIRPELYWLCVITALWFLIDSRCKPRINVLWNVLLFLSLGSTFCIGWGIRNYRWFGSFGQSTNPDTHLSWAAAPGVLGEAVGTDFHTASLMVAERIESQLDVRESGTGLHSTGFERSRIFGRVARQIMYEHLSTSISVVSKAAIIKVLDPNLTELHQLMGDFTIRQHSGIFRALLQRNFLALVASLRMLGAGGTMISLDLSVVFLHMSRLFLAVLGVRSLLLRRQWRVLAALLTQLCFFSVASLVHYDPRHFLPALPTVCILISMVHSEYAYRCDNNTTTSHLVCK